MLLGAEGRARTRQRPDGVGIGLSDSSGSCLVCLLVRLSSSSPAVQCTGGVQITLLSTPDRSCALRGVLFPSRLPVQPSPCPSGRATSIGLTLRRFNFVNHPHHGVDTSKYYEYAGVPVPSKSS